MAATHAHRVSGIFNTDRVVVDADSGNDDSGQACLASLAVSRVVFPLNFRRVKLV